MTTPVRPRLEFTCALPVPNCRREGTALERDGLRPVPRSGNLHQPCAERSAAQEYGFPKRSLALPGRNSASRCAARAGNLAPFGAAARCFAAIPRPLAWADEGRPVGPAAADRPVSWHPSDSVASIFLNFDFL